MSHSEASSRRGTKRKLEDAQECFGRRKSKRLAIRKAEENGNNSEAERLRETITVLPLHMHPHLGQRRVTTERQPSLLASEDDSKTDVVRVLRECYVTFTAVDTARHNDIQNSFCTVYAAEMRWKPWMANDSQSLLLVSACFAKAHVDTLCKRGLTRHLPFALQDWQGDLNELLTVIDLQSPTHFMDSNMNGKRCGDILLLKRVRTEPGFAKRGLGRCLVQRIIDIHCNPFDRIVLKPFPLQHGWSAMPGKVHPVQTFEDDLKKVIEVWETMGFRQIGISDMWGKVNQGRDTPIN
mmetsp:Transcript_47294/g.78483  ORF Transcript_47294/g.78483 Transcript_47294/m.78483 type:complete len:295 (+) Transcript_47294:31-915(+)